MPQAAASDRRVEVVLNCFERNYRQVLSPGWLQRAFAQHEHSFALRTLLINNVEDLDDAIALARGAVRAGELDRWVVVAESVDRALEHFGLSRRDFGRYLHWSDCCAVALTLDGPDLLCYVDVDLDLTTPADWITPGLDILDRRPDVLVVNPQWVMPDGRRSAVDEADFVDSAFAVGYGFSDQVFLTRRSQWRSVRLGSWIPPTLTAPASMRYFGVPGSYFFEQVVDAHMRRRRLLRATYLPVDFEPKPLSTYEATGRTVKAWRRVHRRVLHALDRAWVRWPALVSHPRVRAAGLMDPRGRGRG